MYQYSIFLIKLQLCIFKHINNQFSFNSSSNRSVSQLSSKSSIVIPINLLSTSEIYLPVKKSQQHRTVIWSVSAFTTGLIWCIGHVLLLFSCISSLYLISIIVDIQIACRRFLWPDRSYINQSDGIKLYTKPN